MDGKRPRRPYHLTFTERLWALTERCWNQDPRLRPDVSEVLRVSRSSSVALSVLRLAIR